MNYFDHQYLYSLDSFNRHETRPSTRICLYYRYVLVLNSALFHIHFVLNRKLNLFIGRNWSVNVCRATLFERKKWFFVRDSIDFCLIESNVKKWFLSWFSVQMEQSTVQIIFTLWTWFHIVQRSDWCSNERWKSNEQWSRSPFMATTIWKTSFISWWQWTFVDLRFSWWRRRCCKNLKYCFCFYFSFSTFRNWTSVHRRNLLSSICTRFCPLKQRESDWRTSIKFDVDSLSIRHQMHSVLLF